MRVALMIDGGHLRACAKAANHNYENSFIEAFSHRCIEQDEYLLRIFYYDSPQFRGTVQLPVSGQNTQFQSNDNWLRDLSKRDRFAVRRGTLGFRGWRPKSIPVHGGALADNDFTPVFEQKGVDMRIGLDIATFSQNNAVDRIILVSGDTDMVPAMKHARKSGLEVVVVQLAEPSAKAHDLLFAHADFVRPVAWN